MPKISIIVPVYKVEKYIARCIESILAQTFQEWELILVDDGSPDRSGAICDEFAQKDSRIEVYHKENGGVSAARNYALDRAQGEFVTFIDSDDWIEKESLDVCIKEIEEDQLDLLQFGYKQVSESGKTLSVVKLGTPIVGREQYIELGKFNVCAGGSIYRLSIIQQHNLRFEIGMKLGEDQMFFFEYLMHACKMRSIPQTFYCYFLNYNSATARAKSDDIVKSMTILGTFADTCPISHNHLAKVQNAFLKNVLQNYDTSSVEYQMLFNNYFEYNAPHTLGLYLKLSTISPAIAYACCGVYYQCYFKLRTLAGRFIHKIN